jgi:DNA-binding CsgD family transcriptional regulator
MSLHSNKIENTGGDSGSFVRNRPQVRIMNDNQWLFVRKSFRMSPREMDVAKLVCSGLSNEEIASRMGIKIATVKTHLRNVYRRIRVQRKLDMLLTFLDLGAKYANSASGINRAVVETTTAIDSGLKTDLGSQNHITGS